MKFYKKQHPNWCRLKFQRLNVLALHINASVYENSPKALYDICVETFSLNKG